MRSELCVLLALSGLVPACEREPEAAAPQASPDDAARPGDEEKLLVVDDLVVTFGELGPLVAYLDDLYPEYSYRAKLRAVLDQHWLPVRLARRAFAERRAELARQAGDLAEVADNVHDLESRGVDLGGSRSPRPLVRKEVELPVAAWLFDAANLGGVSGPIEVPQGFKVVAAFDVDRSALAADDRVDAFQVPFFTHDMKSFMDWLNSERERVSGKVTYVHPEFTDVLPEWLRAR